MPGVNIAGNQNTSGNAASSNKLLGTGGVTTHPGTGNLIYNRFASSQTGSLPVSNNANGIITLNTHSGNYN